MPGRLSSVAVYCGSNLGADPAYAEAAASLGRLLAGGGIRLVYGGGQVGLMGVLAAAVQDGGGEVYGVITRALEAKEVANPSLSTRRRGSASSARRTATWSSWTPIPPGCSTG
jgi:uncharacterized protein (TIGR00730 family)